MSLNQNIDYVAGDNLVWNYVSNPVGTTCADPFAPVVGLDVASRSFALFDIATPLGLVPGRCYTAYLTNLGDPNGIIDCGLMDAQVIRSSLFGDFNLLVTQIAGVVGIAEGETGSFQFIADGSDFLEMQVQGSGNNDCTFEYFIEDTTDGSCVP